MAVMGTQVCTAGQDLRSGQGARTFVLRDTSRSPSMGMALLAWELASLSSPPWPESVCVPPTTDLLPPVVLETRGLDQRLQASRIRGDFGSCPAPV